MSRKIARRYARALFLAARERGLLSRVSEELSAVAELYRSDIGFRDLLLTPVGDHLAKVQSVSKLAGAMCDLTCDLLGLLVEKRREDILLDVQEEFEVLRKEYEGLADAEIITAKELSYEERQHLILHLERKTGMRVVPTFTVDPELIGGVRVILAGTLMDGSIKGNLDELREKLYRDVLIQA